MTVSVPNGLYSNWTHPLLFQLEEGLVSNEQEE